MTKNNLGSARFMCACKIDASVRLYEQPPFSNKVGAIFYSFFLS